jgi:methyl-accepting chemotaxis protein
MINIIGKLLKNILNKLNKKLFYKILSPLVIIILLVTAAAVFIISSAFREEINQNAQNQVAMGNDKIISSLSTINQLMLEQVQSAVKILKKESLNLGNPSVSVTENSTPEIKFGENSVLDNAIVDEIKSLTGSSATIFVKDGQDFIRISTNVLKEDGSRAIGTKLDPNGAAIKQILNNKPFYGMVDILGQPYITAYEPVTDEQGSIVGIWYVGFKINILAELKENISKARILSNGFVALKDYSNRIVFHSSHLNDSEIENIIKEYEAGETTWKVQLTSYDPWKFTLITAYSESEISEQIFSIITATIIIGIVIAVVLFLIIGMILKKSVINKITNIVSKTNELSKGNTTIEFNKNTSDEIGSLQGALQQMVNNINEQAYAVKQLAKGDFNINLEMKSNHDVLSESIINVVNIIKELTAEINSLDDAAIRGDIKHRANADKFHGGYSELIKGINTTHDTILNPVHEGINILKQMADHNLTSRVTGNYSGDHELIKKSINLVADSMSQALKEVAEAVLAASSASSEISSSTEQMAAGAQEQSAQTR